MDPKFDFGPSSFRNGFKAEKQHVDSPQILRRLKVLNISEKPEVAKKLSYSAFFRNNIRRVLVCKLVIF